ncbi:hypothetical protein COU78_04085 [Candidatus Peregrinibacteria bacterium CG10_big_fil_rev_8_21_14_0_10_49_24]|nr:MAG: hypothetical protein COV83_00615 [Candidatus Peregrinibacteria bacterium CG11_big_fil_rev_8_21_14_0_20_49_14]PIR50848.1 MAG: hypothetical protein COU78_04085 [Candidatus Peregrinibacteria bacterium CG10_big_fil_rev_8_21_14_0_10_49_24]PJA67125.1 MAG: hypothetical protein CO157_06015 [Candidatus Peregrinibacteria bacterium CG_4_9_14_3_um_filter_49_12]
MEIFSSIIGNYHGADWAGMILQCISIYFLGNQKRIGFLMGIGGNAGWFIFGILTGSIPDLLSQCVVATLNCRGYLQWHTSNIEDSPPWLLSHKIHSSFPHPLL